MEAIMAKKIQVTEEDLQEALDPKGFLGIDDEVPEYFEMTEHDWFEFERDFEIALNMMEIGHLTGCSGPDLYRRAERMYNDEHGLSHR